MKRNYFGTSLTGAKTGVSTLQGLGADVSKENTTAPAMRKTKAAKKRSPSFAASTRGAGSVSPTGSDDSRSGSSNDAAPPPRRPIRPVDRQKMLDWLKEKLDSKEMPRNLWWKEKGKIFAVKWPHAARHGFSSKEDARLFKAWAEHTGLHKDGDQADHKRWKSNFRCAIHSLPDLKEKTPKEGRKGPHAARVYEILEEPEPKKKSKNCSRAQVSDDEEQKGEDSDSGMSNAVDSPGSLPLSVSHLLETPSHSQEGSNIPNFHSLGLIIQQNHLSGGCMTVREEPPANCCPIITSISSEFFSMSFPSRFSTSFPASSSSPSSFPVPTTTTTTTTTLPSELADMEMKPVGIMMVSSRDRAPSGDSGVPGSPPLEGQEEVLQVGQWLRVEDLEISDEGIEDIGADISIETLQMQGPVQLVDSVQWPGGEIFLDISRNTPEPAVATQVTGEADDYRYTSMETA